jgi:DNA-binding CsgD family transcriptional regulator/tetratricopeptide (TPR) repeat protein
MRDDHGSLVLISGEAGIGKTALVEWLADEAVDQGCLALRGGCYDLATTPPTGPWREAFARAAATHSLERDDATSLLQAMSGDSSDNAISQAQLHEQVQQFLARMSERQPLVIVLEDLHWSDPVSLDLLRHAGRTLQELPILLLITYRDDDIATGDALARLLPLLIRESEAVRLHPGQLSAELVGDLVGPRYALNAADASRLVTHVVARTDGNPFFVNEVLQGLEDDRLLRPVEGGWVLGDLTQARVSPLLRQLLESRLGRLEPRTRHALQVAAVIGQEVELDLWQELTALDDQELDHVIVQALESHALEEAPGIRLRFRHALLREAFYTSLTPRRRRTLHQQIGDRLSEKPNVSPSAVAFHFQRAGDPREIEWQIRSGLHARRSAAWFTAAECFERAANLLAGDVTQTRRRGWLLFYAGFLWRYSTDARTIACLNAAEALAVAGSDPILEAYVHYHRGSSRCMRGDLRRGVAEIEAGVTALEESTQAHLLPSTEEHVLATIQSMLSENIPHSEPAGAERPARALGAPAPIQQRGVLINWLGMTGRYVEARAMGESFCIAMADALGERLLYSSQCMSGHLGLGHAYAALGMPEDARRMYALAARGFALIGDPAQVEYVIWVELLMAVIRYQTDRLGERERLRADSARVWVQSSGSSVTTGGDAPPSSLLLDLIEGRWSEARQLAEAQRNAAILPSFQSAILALGILARNQGAPDRAWEQVRAILPDGAATEPGDYYFPLGLATVALAVDLTLDAGDVDAAKGWIETYERWIAWSGAVLGQAMAALLRARYYAATGDHDLARQHAVRARALASEPRQPLVLLAVERILGVLAMRDGRADDAERHLSESLNLAERCAAPFERALTLIAQAALRMTTGQPAEAQTLLEAAREIALGLDAHPTLERIKQMEVSIGSLRSMTPSGSVLSPRERDVLRLIVEGKSDREIASDLFISPHTVMRHVSNILGKLEVESRTAAATHALRHNLL